MLIFGPTKKPNAKREALKLTIEKMTGAKKEFYERHEDYTWKSCARGELLRLFEVTPEGLF